MPAPLRGSARYFLPSALLAVLGAVAAVTPGTVRAEDPPPADVPVLRTYPVPSGGARALAEALTTLYAPSASRRIEAADDDTLLVYAAPEEQRAIEKRLAGGAGDSRPAVPRSDPATRSQATGVLLVHQFVDPQEKKDEKPAAKKEEKGAPPVTITALGNKLIITSDDPDAIREVRQLVRYLTEAPASAASFQVIRLKNTNAVDAAKVLDEAFNGPKQTQPQQPQRGFGRFAPPAPAAPPREDRVRVVPDPDTNTLLVRASPLDMVTIRRLLGTAIDSSSDDNSGAIHTYVIGPLKYAVATEVADVLQNVYHEHTDNNPNVAALGGRGRGGFFRRALAASAGNQNLGPDGQPRPVTLTIGVDNQTNSIVVACSKSLHDDVKGLVDQLEEASRNSRRTVEVVPLK
ncbi:MAG TPA: secretin N-terminal domain-containing protein, partial [Gemmataceae bacterium]|nr:secretin N-terminal domain-containing protein [Gemmataceae bacterium]